MTYCDGLALGGRDDWHLPTINELRSLIRGCPATETGGSCGVTDTCLGDGCRNDACVGCSFLGGPGTGEAYWPPRLGGTAYWYWSSSSYAGGASNAWSVAFHCGYVDYYDETLTVYVRCVRPGP